MVEAHCTLGEDTTVERRYYLTSLASNAEQFGQAARGHWSMENGLHWVLDVAFQGVRADCGAIMPPKILRCSVVWQASLLRQEKSCPNGKSQTA